MEILNWVLIGIVSLWFLFLFGALIYYTGYNHGWDDALHHKWR